MNSPWLGIPIDDYEGHMSLPGVGQAQMLAAELDGALERWSPKSVAVIGCAGGNGFEKIQARGIHRVIALDVNPAYIERVRARYAQRWAGLELICADVQSESLQYEPVEFTYAGLVLEYVDVVSTLKTVRRNSRPGATLTVVSQLPHPVLGAVSRSPYESLGRLSSIMKLVAPQALRRAAAAVGFTAVSSTNIGLPSGKSFSVQCFRA